MTRMVDASGTLVVGDRRPADRAQWHAAVRLATLLSLLAVPLAVVAAAVGASAPVVVLGVIVAGFVSSWSQSGRLAHPVRVHTS